MITLARASVADAEVVLPMTAALNEHEGIALDREALRASLVTLLGDPTLGGVWKVLDGGAVVGYAIVTFGYDLEFGGRDAVLTELWVDESMRGRGAGGAAIELLEPELRAAGVHALHLQVRPDNPAARLYLRRGFVASPRTIMTRRFT